MVESLTVQDELKGISDLLNEMKIKYEIGDGTIKVRGTVIHVDFGDWRDIYIRQKKAEITFGIRPSFRFLSVKKGRKTGQKILSKAWAYYDYGYLVITSESGT
jgi:extradiol dioxygenase family protein